MTAASQRATYLGYRIGSAVANALPGPLATALAHVLGAALSVVLRGRRRMITRHMRRALGPKASPFAVQRKVQAAFDSYARYWMESFRLATTSRQELHAGMSWEGVGYIEEALGRGRGVILALPHLGGWDFGGAWFAAAGYPATVGVESLDPPELFEWFRRLRSSTGMIVVAHGADAGTAVLRALRRNELVGLLCDRDLVGNGIEVEFFGERTTLPGGPATLALRTGATLLACAVYFEGAAHFGLVRPPIPTARTGTLRGDVTRITQVLATELESLIRRAPEQWHLMQPNWPSDREVAGQDG